MKKLFSVKLSKSRGVLIVAGLLVAGSGTAYGANELTKQPVSISINGKKQSVRTHAKTVGELMKGLNIKTRKEDHISPAEDTKITSNMNVEYIAAKPVHLAMDGEEKQVWTTAGTVGKLLKELNLELAEHDQIEPSVDKEIKKDMKLTLQRAFKVTVKDAGKNKDIWTTSTTVADFLKHHKISIKGDDEVKPALDETLTKDQANIHITRIKKVTDVVEENIPFDVKKKEDASLEKGTEKVVQDGKEGKLKKHYAVIKKNGKEVSRELIKEETAAESKAKIIAVGTKRKTVAQISTNVSRGNEASGKEFYVTSTAYTASCSGCSGHTATGVNLKNNPGSKVIAVDPSFIPLGTKVHVEGYGYAVAADTGSAIKGRKIDVFFPSKSAAYRWGNKRVKIKVLN
ncbi:G5 and 3D domain-containing protein [Bacillus sonorensis]|uniref:G5 and 3D domain-containing protein n=1 Tax=Bacillus sonorensis TaxID=119858 RepID=UPI000495714B|nr:G5 and 3D domain-containing protein [Bacillus sonorensis]MCY8088254.1 ubiquitin-like domain-containing protein [Bacillus sonorensis]MEC1538620.1 ubiquitin-like domain-containing protein [Bacillus sonorensis]MEC1591886.1 ubiquitin-like domain-containing protein [Bacillus sonorensis]